MHDHAVIRGNRQSCHVAHEMGRKFGSELAAVLIAPEQLGSLAIFRDTDDTQIGFRVGIHVLEILAGAGDDKDLADNGGCVKAQRDSADDLVQNQIFGNCGFVQQIADITAVPT